MTFTKAAIMIVSMLGAGTGVANASGMVSVRALSSACSKSVDPSTMVALVHFESGGNPYAINVNGGYRLPRQPRNKFEAMKTAQWLATHGYNYDSGIAQVNSSNQSKKKVTISQIFDPCVNMKVGGDILFSCYKSAVGSFGEGQVALHHALSCYNTGSPEKGIANGYVRKVIQLAKASGAKELMVPALLTDGNGSPDASTPVTVPTHAATVERVPSHAKGETVDAFGETGSGTPDAFGAAQAASKPDTMVQASHQEVVTQGKPNVQEGVSRSSTPTDEDNGRRDDPESHSL